MVQYETQNVHAQIIYTYSQYGLSPSSGDIKQIQWDTPPFQN